jgi:hypothetical protein
MRILIKSLSFIIAGAGILCLVFAAIDFFFFPGLFGVNHSRSFIVPASAFFLLSIFLQLACFRFQKKKSDS